MLSSKRRRSLTTVGATRVFVLTFHSSETTEDVIGIIIPGVPFAMGVNEPNNPILRFRPQHFPWRIGWDHARHLPGVVPNFKRLDKGDVLTGLKTASTLR
jgi:hypothetical protein